MYIDFFKVDTSVLPAKGIASASFSSLVFRFFVGFFSSADSPSSFLAFLFTGAFFALPSVAELPFELTLFLADSFFTEITLSSSSSSESLSSCTALTVFFVGFTAFVLATTVSDSALTGFRCFLEVGTGASSSDSLSLSSFSVAAFFAALGADFLTTAAVAVFRPFFGSSFADVLMSPLSSTALRLDARGILTVGMNKVVIIEDGFYAVQVLRAPFSGDAFETRELLARIQSRAKFRFVAHLDLADNHQAGPSAWSDQRTATDRKHRPTHSLFRNFRTHRSPVRPWHLLARYLPCSGLPSTNLQRLRTNDLSMVTVCQPILEIVAKVQRAGRSNLHADLLTSHDARPATYSNHWARGVYDLRTGYKASQISPLGKAVRVQLLAFEAEDDGGHEAMSRAICGSIEIGVARTTSMRFLRLVGPRRCT